MAPRDLFNSFFVSSTHGGSYLALDEREQLLASIVFPLAFAEVSRRRGADVQTEPGAFDVKVEATRENLKKILDLFSKVQKARDEFISCYPEWSKLRRRNIEELKATAKSMNKDRFNCNVSRLVGSSVGIAGGAALITCLLLPPAAVVIVPLSIAGGGVSLVGGGVVFGTSATEYGLLKKKMNKTQQILKDDQEAFQEGMGKWFEHTIALVEAVETVVGFQVMKTLAKDLKEFTNDVVSWNATFRTALKNSLGLIFDADNNFMASLGIHLTSIILTFCVVVIVAHQRNAVLLDCVILTHRLVFGLLSGLDLGVEVGRGIIMAVRGGKFATDISAKVARAVFHGVFGGIGVTLDVINIVLTSIDVHKGSRSKQGMQILQATDKLNEELEFLKEVYEGLGQDAARTILPIEMPFDEIKLL